MYAAGAFNAHNPWWFAMPDLTGYLQRVSFALRQGKPVNDIALLLPNDDAWASFTVPRQSSDSVTTKTGFNTRGENLSIDESMGKLLGRDVIPQILDAGLGLDFIDGDAIDALGIKYPVLVLPGVDRLPLSTYMKIEQYALHGGIVIATRSLPSTAPGLVNAENDSKQIRGISQRLFREQGAPGHFLEDESQLGAVAASYFKPDVVFTPKTPELGFTHRQLNDGDLYFVANTSNQPKVVGVKFRSPARSAEWWDPFTGRVSPVENAARIELSLQPYESRLIFFDNARPGDAGSNSTAKAKASSSADPHPAVIDLSVDWNLTFGGSNQSGLSQSIRMANLHSWSEEESYKFYSGQVTYEKVFDLPADLKSGTSMILDFGAGTPVAKPDPLPTFNLRAFLEGPVRDAAEIYVNGQRAGVVWHPPYTVDVSSLLKAGNNELRIVVGNTAINSLAGRALPDYRLLYDRYGERFVPQGMDNLQPLPSGILGGLRLKISRPHPGSSH